MIEQIKDLFSAAAGFDTMAILKIYSMFVVGALPFSFIAMIIICLKTPFLDRYNAFLDKLRRTEKKNRDEQIKTKKEENSQKEEDKEPINEDTMKKNDIDPKTAHFRLSVGKQYKCRLPEVDETMNDQTWISENRFVGSFDENTFTAEKVGETYLDCGKDRQQYYKITVWPNFYWALDDIVKYIINFDDICIASIRLKELGATLVKEGEDNIKRFTGIKDESSISLLMKGEKDNLTVKAMMIEYENNNEKLELLFNILDERFGELKVYKDGKEVPDTGNELFYYHESPSDLYGEKGMKVDAVCYLRELNDGRILLGITRPWRENAELPEIQDNREMVPELFYEMLPEEVRKEIDEKNAINRRQISKS